MEMKRFTLAPKELPNYTVNLYAYRKEQAQGAVDALFKMRGACYFTNYGEKVKTESNLRTPA